MVYCLEFVVFSGFSLSSYGLLLFFCAALYLPGFTVYSFIDQSARCKNLISSINFKSPMTAWVPRIVVYHFRAYFVKWGSLRP